MCYHDSVCMYFILQLHIKTFDFHPYPSSHWSHVSWIVWLFILFFLFKYLLVWNLPKLHIEVLSVQLAKVVIFIISLLVMSLIDWLFHPYPYYLFSFYYLSICLCNSFPSSFLRLCHIFYLSIGCLWLTDFLMRLNTCTFIFDFGWFYCFWLCPQTTGSH